ncbi:MAG: T9SS type A sorting domain-containing protein [Candidatus Accumulibacter sp.]|jgi:hypothetical protein|nr:T9SS type A sorting domain-containing protein [Accumulibacter sp.]
MTNEEKTEKISKELSEDELEQVAGGGQLGMDEAVAKALAEGKCVAYPAGEDCNIKVFNTKDLIEIYTILGQKIESAPGTGGEQTIAVPGKGVYMLKTGKQAFKCIVR